MLTDIHDAAQVNTAAKVIDVLQIPAFLCRQTDLLLAAAKSGRAVNVKKGQFLAPDDVDNIAAKLQGCGLHGLFHHRERDDVRLPRPGRGHARAGDDAAGGASRGVRCDAIRCSGQAARAQSTGGDRTMAPVLARAAVAAGIDGLFIETHPRPDQSPSDGPNMIPLAQMEGLLRTLKTHP